MAGKRDRIVTITEYLNSLGVTVNIGKTKARGNRGIFMGGGKQAFRIDIAKDAPQESILQVLIHEFAHYVHYCYDKKMESLDFINKDISSSADLLEELLNVTVSKIPKSAVVELYGLKEKLRNEIKMLSEDIKVAYPDFKLSSPYRRLEKSLKNPVKYLLKYDRVRVFYKVYSIEHIKDDFPYLSPAQAAYIMIKSKQRALGRINSRISKMNRYYNRPAELFARFVELYFLDLEKSRKEAPLFSQVMDNILQNNRIPELTQLKNILSNV